MIASRLLTDLLPSVRSRFVEFERIADASLRDAGIDLIWTSTYRDNESQDQMYAQGRTRPGAIVTNAQGGKSYHQYRVAADFALLFHGKTVSKNDDFLMWDNTPERITLWKSIGVLAELSGLEWAGKWKSFKELAHVQYTGGLSIAQLKSGLIPK